MAERVAMAIAAHPDDIEFMMAGTLLLLRQAGYKTHYLTLANGSCGSADQSAAEIKKTRQRESRKAAQVLGAQFHESLVNDIEIIYEAKLLRRLAGIVRQVEPVVLLIHSPQDYMEDHTNACRLAVTAAFVRGMPNFRTTPPRAHTDRQVTIYHAMPHGMRNALRKRINPGAFVDTTSVQDLKRSALACHRSQQQWLDTSQQLSSYMQAMEEMSLQLGSISGRFKHAEGWRRHLHFGFCAPDADPLREALGQKYLVNREYEAELEG
ncbi:MAG TPA: PIG-L family deacetylase [Acidobacteriota bacterium]|jgi:LmbE family N-acetylglucosaminyl deacetylase